LEEANGKMERRLLVQAWEILHRYQNFITFNGIAFDVPVLNLHSLFRRVRPAVNISTKKYQIGNHIDLRAILGNWDNFAPGNLDFYLRRCLGNSKPQNMDGSMVQHYWDTDLKDEIVTYGVGDAEDTWELYQHVKQFYPGIA
jgi:predicted PolB exonuclease-like 3'-5' exonuclease